ncbi:hypothetical protein KAJ27_02530 [bacterium]|nr:hypothetical protein [bacterium]
MKKDVIKISIYVLCIGAFYWLMTSVVDRVEREYWLQKKTRNCIFFYRSGKSVELEKLILQTQKNMNSLVTGDEKIKIFVYPVKYGQKQIASISNGTIFCFRNSVISKKMLEKAFNYNKKLKAKYRRYKPIAR